MNIILQYVIIALLIIVAIIYFIKKGKNGNANLNCDENCSQCDLYKHCNSKK